MLSIGEFSKMCGVSRKTLRYYDEIGLLHPDVINPESGYRYYSTSQLRDMLMINRLKSYQFSLEDIKFVLELEGKHFHETLFSSLINKKKEILKQIHEYEKILNQIGNEIDDLDNGRPFMSDLDKIAVQLVETKPINLFSIRQLLTSDDYTPGYGRYFSRLFERIAAEKLTLQGTPMTIYHSAEHNPNGNDTEFAIPVLEEAEGTRVLPGGLCARAVHKGSYLGMPTVYAKLYEWVENEEYELADSPYEVYVTDPNRAAAPEDTVTEVYFPVRKKQ